MQPGHSVTAARITTGVLCMKLGFICPNAAGHLNPITALARQLQARNHDVVFLYSSGAAGLPFVPGPDKDGPVPKNAIMVKRAPQLELLKQTSVCITHAGLNTVRESLAQGVPQVAIPVTYDQRGVAAADCASVIGRNGPRLCCSRGKLSAYGGNGASTGLRERSG